MVLDSKDQVTMKKQNFKCNSVLFYLFLEGFLIERETSKRNFLVVELFCVYPLNLETCREKERIKNRGRHIRTRTKYVEGLKEASL